MNDILIFRHAAHEGPGYLADYLRRRGVNHRLIRIDRNEPIPAAPDAAGLVFMGGPMSVNDPLPWISQVTALIRQAVERDIPVLGHCLGGQLISQALGGTVGRNPVREIGWLPVMRVDGAVAEPWLDGLPQEFDVFHWHGETFSIPPGATRILASRDCANQAFVLGRTLAFQCHIEMDGPMVRDWAAVGAEEIAQQRCATVQDADAMTADLDTRVAGLQRIADHFYDRWIDGLS